MKNSYKVYCKRPVMVQDEAPPPFNMVNIRYEVLPIYEAADCSTEEGVVDDVTTNGVPSRLAIFGFEAEINADEEADAEDDVERVLLVLLLPLLLLRAAATNGLILAVEPLEVSKS